MIHKIDYSDIKKYKRYLTLDLNTSSRLYYDNDVIHKIFYEKSINLEEILLLLDKLNLNELVEVRNWIYKNDAKNTK